MGIDGLIVLDKTGRPIIQSGFRSASTAYPLLHVDAFNHALDNARRPADVDPVLYIPSYNTIQSPSACCHIPCADMRFLCPISGNIDPLFAFAFLQTFTDILHEYFGTLSAAKLKENFDVVYQLLEETLDSGGHPLTTSPNALRDIVLPPSLLTKLLSVAGANINTTINSGAGLGSAGGPFSSSIPWRKAGLKYSSNEIYFDMVEKLEAIVNKHGVTLSSSVWGKIQTNTRLTGTPDCLLTFANPQVLADCAFHPCVRLQRWTRDKCLSFIPPDGQFILADYRFAPNTSATLNPRFVSPASSTSSPSAAISNLAKDNIAIPLSIKSTFDLEVLSASFEIILTSRLTARTIENLNIEMDLGQGAGGIKCIASRGSGGLTRGGIGSMDVGISGTSGASWNFDTKKKVLRWGIPSVPPSSSWSLQGSFSTSISPPRPSHALQVRFEIQSHTYSALKVEQLKISGEQYKPYKGVRGRSVGNVEWRW